MTSAVPFTAPVTPVRAAALAVENLRQIYAGHAAVDGVSWSAAAGETVCLLGHSGCGKTTLLRLIAGLETPAGGRVLVDGQELSGPNAFVPPEQRRIGLVFQDYALFPHLSVLDNVLFGLRGGDKAGARAKALQALTRVGLAERAGHFPHQLSGGEQQRVALARALAPEPRVLLMDEPFSNLDRRLRDRVREETMALLREAGTTTVVVTHDPEEALRIADHIVLMHAGRVEQNGSAHALYNHPTSLFAARFFSDLNAVPGRVGNGVVETPLGRFPTTLAAGDTTVYLRPQHLDLGEAGSGIAGRVLRTVFLGHGEELQVAVDGLPDPLLLQLPQRALDGSHAVGQQVWLQPQYERALIFAARD